MKKVPHLWYQEMVNSLARTYMDAKTRPAFQQRRIDAVIASGKDHEVMKNGFIIPLTELQQFHRDAVKEAKTAPAKRQAWLDFKAKYTPDKNLKGNLTAAKLAAEVAFLKGRKTDYRYSFLHKLMDRYKLSDKQTTQLMDHFDKIGIEF